MRHAANRIAVPPQPASFLPLADQERLRRNAPLRDRHIGRRAFVLGTGPSLALQNLAPLGGELTFATNAFFSHPVLSQWRPTYYCAIDPACFDGSEASNNYLRAIRDAGQGSTFFVPLYYHAPFPSVSLVEVEGLLPASRTHYLALGGDLELGRTTDLDLTQLLPPFLTVVQAAVAVAIYMGCEDIYLMGLDHDWVARPAENTHFYSPAEYTVAEVRDVAILKATFRLARQLDVMTQQWRGYALLDQVARATRSRIWNATAGGFLDVFPRVDYAGLVASRT